MDLQEIKKIVDLMENSGLSEFEVQDEKLKLRICREGSGHVVAAPGQPVASVTQAAPALENKPAAAAASEEGLDIIKSPMVGTFYRSSSPEAAPFVETGARVTSETTVCIIEAMKVMNEIHAEMQGTVVEILVENGQSVEYGQPLFKVKKA